MNFPITYIYFGVIVCLFCCAFFLLLSPQFCQMCRKWAVYTRLTMCTMYMAENKRVCMYMYSSCLCIGVNFLVQGVRTNANPKSVDIECEVSILNGLIHLENHELESDRENERDRQRHYVKQCYQYTLSYSIHLYTSKHRRNKKKYNVIYKRE